MRGNKWWILAGASGVIMLMVLKAATAELPSDQPSNDWVQSSGRHNRAHKKRPRQLAGQVLHTLEAEHGDDPAR
jgi:hypothetical protein